MTDDQTNDDSTPSNRHKVVFPVTPFQEELLDLIKNLDEPAKWPAINSVKHLNRAWKLIDLDPTMATFRTITAEEEAATAIFWSLQRLRYPGADQLKHTNHVHKQALIPFLDAVHALLTKTARIVKHMTLRINRELIPRTVELFIEYQPPIFPGYETSPQPPLHFAMLLNEREPDLKNQLDTIATKNGMKSISHVLRRRADLRNQLLYANTNGINELKTPIPTILEMGTKNVFRLLTILLLIDPHPREQLFVRQLLDVFTAMLKQVPKDLKFL